MASKPNLAKTKLLVLFSDLHVGSTTALFPEGFITKTGNGILLNPYQKWLLACWHEAQRYVAKVCAEDPYGLVLNGDVIEGIHHKTTQIVSASVEDQFSAAIKLLEPVVQKADYTFMVNGTECHTGDLEDSIAGVLEAVKNPETKRHSFDRLTLDIHGVRCVFRHHIAGATRRSLAASALGVQLAEEQVEAALNGEKVPSVICAAHRHKFSWYEDESGLCLVTPPWQLLTRHGHKVVSAARTKCGVVILDWRGLPIGSKPRVHSLIFGTPQPKAISL